MGVGAKGREWDRVRLAEDFKIAGDEPGKLGSEEELRLFYVAATRAKHHLGMPAKYVIALNEAEAVGAQSAELPGRQDGALRGVN